MRFPWLAAHLLTLVMFSWLLFGTGGAANDPYDCTDGWFGEDCKYECHCNASVVCNKTTGDCDENDVCAPGWFGTGCQYIDVTYTSSAEKWLKDANDSTCNTPRNDIAMVVIHKPMVIRWMRIVGRDNTAKFLKQMRAFYVTEDGDEYPTKIDSEHSHKVVETYVYLRAKLVRIGIVGKAAGYMCSLYMSGGRRIGVTAVNITSGSNPENVVDGSTAGTSCTSTLPTDRSPALTITLDREYIIYDVTLQTHPHPGCSPGAAENPYNRHCYTFNVATKNYYDAENACRTNGSYLAVPLTARDHDLLIDLWKTAGHASGNFWIGLDSRKGHMTWSTGQTFLMNVSEHLSWGRDSPDKSGRYPCVGYDTAVQKLSSFDCQQTMHYVCEYDYLFPLQGFKLEGFGKSGIRHIVYRDHSPETHQIYSVPVSAKRDITAQRFVIRPTKPDYLVLKVCEIDIFGDSYCAGTHWGLNCEHKCNCQKPPCFPSSGGCPHKCAIGYVGSACDQRCEKGFYGMECAKPCPGCFECHYRTGVCLPGTELEDPEVPGDKHGEDWTAASTPWGLMTGLIIALLSIAAVLCTAVGFLRYRAARSLEKEEKGGSLTMGSEARSKSKSEESETYTIPEISEAPTEHPV